MRPMAPATPPTPAAPPSPTTPATPLSTTNRPPPAPPVLREADVAERLGSPAPRIQPGRAIAGKVAFLEIGGSGSRSFDMADPLGGPAAHVDARPTYRVDWGDGAVIETSSN